MKARCPRCGKLVKVIIPPGGDGSAFIFIRHKPTSLDAVKSYRLDNCDGSRQTVADGAEVS